MPITEEIKKTTEELRKTLSDPTPLFALAGAGDLAYEKLREVPGRVEAMTADRKGTQEKAAARLQEAQAKLVEAQAKVTGSVTALPTDLKSLQEKAQSFALQQVGRAVELAVKAKEVYDELAERGKVVVEKGRPGEAGAESGVVVVALDEPAEPEPAEAAELTPGAVKKPVRARKSPGAEKTEKTEKAEKAEKTEKE